MSEPETLTAEDRTPRLLRWAPFGVLVLFGLGFAIHALFFETAVEPFPDAVDETAVLEPLPAPESAGAAANAPVEPGPSPHAATMAAAAAPKERGTAPARTAAAAGSRTPAGPSPADLRGAAATDAVDFEPLGERLLVSTTIEGTVFVDGRPAGRGFRVVLKDLSQGLVLESVPTGARGAYTVDVEPGNRYMPLQVVTPDGRRLDSDPATVPFSISNGERLTLNIRALDKKLPAVVAPTPAVEPPSAEPSSATAPATVWGKIQHPVLDGPAVGHRLVLESVPGGSRSYSAPSAEDGTYEIQLLPGRYKIIAVQGPEGALWWLQEGAPFYLAPAQRLRFEAVEYRR